MRTTKADVLNDALRRQKWKCCWCGCQLKRPVHGQRAPNDATREHMIPKLFGGAMVKGNIRAACRSCNEKRGAEMDKGMRAQI